MSQIEKTPLLQEQVIPTDGNRRSSSESQNAQPPQPNNWTGYLKSYVVSQ